MTRETQEQNHDWTNADAEPALDWWWWIDTEVDSHRHSEWERDDTPTPPTKKAP